MENLANLFIGASAITVILSVIGAFGTDIWLASTQWILIAAVLAIYGLFFKKA